MQRNRRHDRVRELLKRAVGEVIREMFSIQEVGVVSVTDVGILKYTPEIRFQIDDSVERGNHILDILDQLEREGLKPESSEDNE